MRKARQTATGEFVETITLANKAELDRYLSIPNISVREIFDFLVDIGFKGSLQSAYKWYEQQKIAGQQAAAMNLALQEYQGIDRGKILDKLIVVLTMQMDKATEAIAAKEIDGEHYIKALPAISRELTNAISVYNNLEYIKDRKELELSGATRLGRDLLVLFRKEPFYEALEAGIDAMILKIEQTT